MQPSEGRRGRARLSSRGHYVCAVCMQRDQQVTSRCYPDDFETCSNKQEDWTASSIDTSRDRMSMVWQGLPARGTFTYKARQHTTPCVMPCVVSS